MNTSSHLILLFLLSLCLHLSACSNDSDAPEQQVNVWDDGSNTTNTLIWDDDSNNNNTKWAE